MLKALELVIISWFMLGAVTSAVWAEEVLTWQDCLIQAKQNHPDLISAQEQLNQAKADKAINLSSLLPQVSAAMSQQTAQTTTRAQAESYSYSITAQQLIFDGWQSVYDVNAASLDEKSAEYNYELASSQVRLSLSQAFIALLKAQELLGLSQDIAQRRNQNLELVQLRYEAGREHRGSLLNAEANAAAAEFEVIQAQRDVDLAQRQLNKELGRKKFVPLIAKGDFLVNSGLRQQPEFETLSQSTPFLQELAAQKEAARFSLKSAQADFFPAVYANASAGRSDSVWPPRSEEWSAGISLSLPLFEGGSRLAAISRARAVFNQAQADETSGRNSLIFTLEQSWKTWQDTIDEVDVEQKFLEAAQERAKITQAQYSIGLISFDDWSIIEDNLAQTQKSFLNAKAGALLAEAAWIKAKGGTLDYVAR